MKRFGYYRKQLFNMKFFTKFCVILIIVGASSNAFAGWLSRNGIEGNLDSYLHESLKGIKITAVTKTDIKEELPYAKKITTSNKNGSFTFKNLIPHKRYKIFISDDQYISNPIYVTAPEKGTRLPDRSLSYTKKPPKSGIWFYDSRLKKFIDISQNQSQVTIRSHERLGGNAGIGRSGLSAFSVNPEDVLQPFIADKEGYIFIFNKHINDFAQLTYISKSDTNKIPNGYYYNIKDFFGSLYKAQYIKSNISKVSSFKTGIDNLTCFSLKDTAGLHIINTKNERQHMGRILGGELAPRLGYLVYVIEHSTEQISNILSNFEAIATQEKEKRERKIAKEEEERKKKEKEKRKLEAKRQAVLEKFALLCEKGKFPEAYQIYKIELNSHVTSYISFLRDYVLKKKSPHSELALFLIAETYYSNKDYPNAEKEYKVFIEKYPGSHRLKLALLKKGISSRMQAKYYDAFELFDKVIKLYPNTNEAQIAKKEMKVRILVPSFLSGYDSHKEVEMGKVLSNHLIKLLRDTNWVEIIPNTLSMKKLLKSDILSKKSSFEKWNEIETDFMITGHVFHENKNRLRLDVRLYDMHLKEQVFGQRYQGDRDRSTKMVQLFYHVIIDENKRLLPNHRFSR